MKSLNQTEKAIAVLLAITLLYFLYHIIKWIKN